MSRLPRRRFLTLGLGSVGAAALLGVHRFGRRARAGVVAVAVVAALAPVYLLGL
jgi:hypothetical protein